MANITETHPQYADSLVIWELCRDAAKPGAVKKQKTKYLPAAENQIDEPKRYAAYLNRATYYGFTQETLSGLQGLAFYGGTTSTTESSTVFIDKNVDGDGIGIGQQAKSALRAAIQFGRCGLWVDYSITEGDTSKAELKRSGIGATINLFDTFAITDWATKRIGSMSVLSYVRLCTTEYKREGDSVSESYVLERRLRLDDDNQYYVEEYHDDQWQKKFEPKDSNGNRLNSIPFYFIGAVNNDSNVDDAPIYPIADLNIGHYRNSADYENSAWLCGQPQPWATGLNQTWVDENLSGFSFGSGVLLTGPDGSAFGMFQAQPNSQAYEAMLYKQAAMVAMGAKMINASVSFNTATEAVIASVSENSRLQTVMDNVQSGYELALMALAEFMGVTVPKFTIDTDLSAVMTDPQMAAVMLQAWQSGLIAANDARDYMRKSSLIERTDEEIEDEIVDGVDLDGVNDGE